MRALATGDWQAGVRTMTLADQEQVWHRIVDVVLEREVDMFLHGGDLYEGPVVTMEHIAAVRRVFKRLRDAKIPVILIRGNSTHDLALREVDALDIFHDYDGIDVFTRPAAHAVGGVGLCLLPWVSPANMIAKADGAIDRDHLNEEISRMLVEIAGDLRGVFKGMPTILLAHFAISGSALPTGLPVDQMREPLLSWADLDALGFDAVIGAHVHEPQQISQPLIDKTLGIVVGSPQQLNFGEKGEHGCWIVEVGDGPATAEFVPIDSKRFLTITVPSPDALYSIPWGVSEGDIVRVRVTATEQEMRVWNHEGVREAMVREGASRVQIEPQIVRANRARAETMSDELTPVEALALYCENEKIEERLARRMADRLQEWIT